MFKNAIALARHLRSDLTSILWDGLYGVKTRGSTSALELGLDPTISYPYVPTDWGGLTQILRAIEREAELAEFLDIGSGKGRALIIAALFSFQKVIGVELSDSLCEVALRNTSAFRAKKHCLCKDIEVIKTDATDFTLPKAVNVVYLHNPFHREKMRSFMGVLERSLDDAPRPLYLIYKTPVFHADFLSSGRWADESGRFNAKNSYRVYRSTTEPS